MVTQVTLSEMDYSELMLECSGLSQLINWLDSLESRPGLSEIDLAYPPNFGLKSAVSYR